MKSIHIDQQINILIGDEADQALAITNDTAFISQNKGIVQVSSERWQTAQKTERKHWMVRGLTSSTDRNEEHQSHFDNYAALQNRSFQNAIELGCGPFTNIRLIAKFCSIRAVTLLDPLIESYLDHPFCNYDLTKLFFRYESGLDRIIRKVLRRLTPRLYKSFGNRLLSQSTIPVKQLISKPIEGFSPPEERYDLSVIINVIEHCYDIDLVFKNIVDTLEPDGILVFHDKYYDHDSVVESGKHHYDAAHPLKVDRLVLDAFLDTHFNVLSKKIVHISSQVQGHSIDYEMIYFIGQKK